MTRYLVFAFFVLWASLASAQAVSNRGFVEGQTILYPQEATNDPTQAVGDLLIRDELFLRPTAWLEFAAGADLRANSHDQVENEWRFDWDDRSIQRPRLALRRLTATITKGPFTLDVGKQFIRWARADVLNPTDRFAPKDYLTVVNNDVLPVFGVRPSLQLGHEIFEGVWVGQPTPSRLPLIDQRWAVLPPQAQGIPVTDLGGSLPEQSQYGARWRHVGDRFETSLSYFDGINHIPNLVTQVSLAPGGVPSAIELTRSYPDLRAYGADVMIPTSWFNIKGEAAYLLSPAKTNDDYVLYVVEVERQAGNWLLDGGYAGEVVTEQRETTTPFNPERGLARSIVGRAAYTGDPRRTVSVEGAVRQDGGGVFVKGEYSQSLGEHWRVTATGIGIAGDDDDFIGQYHRNSSASVGLRLSF